MDNNSLMGLLYPLHPRLVHFPIALVVSAMGMQALGVIFKQESWRKCAWLMFVLAAISMPVVILSGLWEAQRMYLSHPVLTLHKLCAFWATGLCVASLPILWFIRGKKVFPGVFLIVLIIISSLLGFAAHQGGRMVYEYGVGVSP